MRRFAGFDPKHCARSDTELRRDIFELVTVCFAQVPFDTGQLCMSLTPAGSWSSLMSLDVIRGAASCLVGGLWLPRGGAAGSGAASGERRTGGRRARWLRASRCCRRRGSRAALRDSTARGLPGLLRSRPQGRPGKLPVLPVMVFSPDRLRGRSRRTGVSARTGRSRPVGAWPAATASGTGQLTAPAGRTAQPRHHRRGPSQRVRRVLRITDGMRRHAKGVRLFLVERYRPQARRCPGTGALGAMPAA